MSRDIKLICKYDDITLYDDLITERSDNGGSDAESILKELAFNFITDQSNYEWNTEYCWDTWDVEYDNLMNYQTDNLALKLIQDSVKEIKANHILFQFF